MLACPQCTTEIPEAPRRGGKPRVYCSRPCQIKAANARRPPRPTYPHAVEPPTQPLAPTLTNIPPSVKTPVSDAPGARLSELMAKAHSRGGINAWEIAELAKLRGRSPWAPLSVILAP
jgi:hypothetical protein